MDQAKLEKYANWLVQNKDKKGTPEFDTVAKAYKEGRSVAGGASVASQQPPKQVNYQDATDDPTWIKNARTLYKEVNKADPKDDYEATTFLKDYLYDFNYRLAGSDKVGLRNTFGVAGDVASFSPEGKKAFLDAQQQFENFDVTLPGMMEAGERILTDPTSFIGITGFGGLARQGVKTAAKEGVEELAKIGVKRGAAKGAAVGAAEGGAYAGVSDLGQQMAQVNAGGQESIDPTQVATSAGYGAIAGGGLGGVAGGVGGYFAGRKPVVQAARQIEANPEKAVRGAEITNKLADVQSTRDVPMQLSDVNQVVDLEREQILSSLKNLGLPKEDYNRYSQLLRKARGVAPEDLAKLRETETGARVADNIEAFKQYRDMTAPRASEGGIKRSIRVGIDYAPIPRVVGDALKYAFLKPRVTGEEQIANVVSPRNVEIAKEIIRLQGSSAATRGRQELLDAGLNMARARKVMRETQKAQEAAERARKSQEFEAKLAEKKNLANANRDMRFQERMNAQRAKVEKEAARASAKAEADNIATAKRNMDFQWKMEGQKKRETSANIDRSKQEQYFQIRMAQQRAKEDLQAQRAIEELEKAQASLKTKEERQFNKALTDVQRVVRFRRAMENLKATQNRTAPSGTTSIPPSGMSPGMAPKAPRASKEAPRSSEGMTAEERKMFSQEGGRIRNEQRWQGGKDTIQEYEQNALEIAKEQPKELRRVLERAVADMRLAKNNQGKREQAFFDAIDAASPYGPEALQVVEDALYFLAKKYQ